MHKVFAKILFVLKMEKSIQSNTVLKKVFLAWVGDVLANKDLWTTKMSVYPFKVVWKIQV